MMPETGSRQGDLISRISESVVVVLVDTSHSGNIGAAARSMKNMGLAQLRLVTPKEFPTEEAVRRSSGATDILDMAKVYDSLDDAVSDVHYVVGASARTRSFPWPVMNPRDCALSVLEKIEIRQSDPIQEGAKVALVFGRESSGLTNDELHKCNAHVNIPANPEYSSLNLAMAVQVISYELRMSALERANVHVGVSALQGPDDEGWDVEPSTSADVDGMLNHLTRVMESTGFYDPKNPGMLVPRLKRLFKRRGLDKMEVNILRGIFKSIEKKLGGS